VSGTTETQPPVTPTGSQRTAGAELGRRSRRVGALVCGVPVAAAVLAFLAGCGSTPEASRTVTVTVATPAVPSKATHAPANTVIPTGEPTDASALTEAGFWRLITETRRAADNDTGRQSGLLQDRLTELSPQAILAFDSIRHRLDESLYTWKLWGAADVIEDGCSDDCFRDFRAYVISLGPDAYASALRNPDSLASVVRNADQGDWENADNVAPDAYSSVTGNDFPRDDSDLSGRPRGTPFNGNNTATLARQYPRLTARFR
jgi:hypothetical protein